MKTNISEITKILRTVWPELMDGNPFVAGNIWIPDAIYWLPTKQDVEQLLNDTFMEHYRWTKEIFDCDTFALILNAFIAQERYVQMEKRKLSKDEWYEWAFFECWGTKFQGEETHHAINGCVTSNEGIILIEPQNDRVWRADSEKDSIYFIKF